MMASLDTIPRWRRANLPTQQRRLRHLRSIAARNISVRNLPSEGNANVSKFDIYFTLHLHPQSKEFYTSEKIKGSLNPTWRSFNPQHLGDTLLETTLSDFIVKVWRGQESRYHLILEWHVNLTGLIYIGDKLQRDGLSYRPDTLIFGMFDGYYSEPHPSTPGNASNARLPEADKQLTVEVASLRMAYTANSMSRIQTVLRAIKQTQASVKKVKKNIEETLAESQKLASKKREKELLEVRINQLRSELQWRTSRMQSEKETHETTQANIHSRDVLLKTKYETLAKDKERLHDKKRAYFDVREELIKTGAQLVMRRKQLISELSLIYPVIEIPNGIYTICNVKLPNSEDFSGQDETMISVALGYTTHLVLMINTFLDVPLRYPMEHRGSRSRITDHIHDKLTDKDREFPLYSKGKEKFQFNYGVYLLNKNIAQLRYYCGLGTTDLRLTLPNLKSLLELRLGVKFDPSTNALAVTPLPPNLGGPQKLTSNFNSRLAPRPELLTDSKPPSRSQSEDSKFEQMIEESQERQSKLQLHRGHHRQGSNLSASDTSDPSTSPRSSQEPTPSEPTKPMVTVDDDPFKASPDAFFQIVQKDIEVLSDPEEKSVHEQLELAQDALVEAVFDKAGSQEAEAALMDPDIIEQATGNLLAPRNKLLQRHLQEQGFDSDVSSTEENINATYESKFKVWPNPDHSNSHNSDSEHQNSEDDSHPPKASRTGGVRTLGGMSAANRCEADLSYPSFKTSAMTAMPTSKPRARTKRSLGGDTASFTRQSSPKPGDRVKIVSDGRYDDDICDRTDALDSFATFKVKLPNSKKGGKGPRGVLDDSLGYGGDSDQ